MHRKCILLYYKTNKIVQQKMCSTHLVAVATLCRCQFDSFIFACFYYNRFSCFGIFPLIVSLVDDAEAVAMATRDVIHEFAADNVKYLEIRSSPKEVTKTGMACSLKRHTCTVHTGNAGTAELNMCCAI